jgi:hypothetical protein
VLAESHRAALAGQFAFYKRFADAERRRFEERVAGFVATKRFISDGEPVDERTKLFIAALACRLSMNLPEIELGRLRTINVVDELDERVLGQMAPGMLQTVTFTRDALADAFRDDDDGLNVVYHEIAHVLDAADGVCDGIPVLLDPREKTTWRDVVASTLTRLRAACDLEIPTAIRAYGARKESDLFATATEAFFERPEKLRNAYPELYALLAAFYRQRPGE